MNLRETKYILGIYIIIHRVNIKIWLGQSNYVNLVLERFKLIDCKSVCAPIMIGIKLFIEKSLIYRSQMQDMRRVPYSSVVCTRTNIAQEIKFLRQFMANPRCIYWDVVKRIFKYVWVFLGYHGYPIWDKNLLCIHECLDSYQARDINSRRSA